MTRVRRFIVMSLLLVGLIGCSSEQLSAPFRPSVDEELLLAAKRGDAVEVWAALAAGTKPDHADEHGNTALIFAARDGHLDVAEVLIGYGATVDWQDDEEVTPLILASSRNHPEIVTLLLSNGARPTIQDQWGRTALDYAERLTIPSPSCSASGVATAWTLGGGGAERVLFLLGMRSFLRPSKSGVRGSGRRLVGLFLGQAGSAPTFLIMRPSGPPPKMCMWKCGTSWLPCSPVLTISR